MNTRLNSKISVLFWVLFFIGTAELPASEIVKIQGTENDFVTFYGYCAGFNNTLGQHNSFFGVYAGFCNTRGNQNTFLGHKVGYYNTTGYNNTFLGTYAGIMNNTGSHNTFIGYKTGAYNITGFENIFVGYETGNYNTSGAKNTFIGFKAGYNNSTGNYNLFLGYYAGYYETGSERLYIDNWADPFPLIYGEFDNEIVAINGKLGVGTKSPNYPIEVATANGAYLNISGNWVNPSRRQLKENIQELTTDEAIETLKELKPVKYNYKVDKEENYVGFIAEDVPELVAVKDRKGMVPMDVVAVLTKVVKEQQKTISMLKDRLAQLEKEK